MNKDIYGSYIYAILNQIDFDKAMEGTSTIDEDVQYARNVEYGKKKDEDIIEVTEYTVRDSDTPLLEGDKNENKNNRN